ncbi:hypothetical protein H0H92_007692 [Tricholoma furcatifolium]|nr:hypothetical protein H0H92_007692 [Tricholoma furcatifolium]
MSCNGRVFASQKGLRAHQKLHEQRDLEEEMALSDAEDADVLQPPRKKRRGGELGRDWKCDMDGCEKDFKSVSTPSPTLRSQSIDSIQKKALETHKNVTHLGRRDHICPHDGCGQSYGYKHLLQRHLARAHNTTSADDGTRSDDSEESDWASSDVAQKTTSLDIDTITGNSYAQRTREKIANASALLCPYPHLDTIALVIEEDASLAPVPQVQTTATSVCEYAFSRAYDLRRHLKAAHGVNAVKEGLDEWVARHKRTRRLAVTS